MHKLSTFMLIALGAACACTGPTPEDPQVKNALARDVAAILETGVVGVQAEHTHDGHDYLASAGVENLHDGRPLAGGSRFRIASTTKTFVMALALTLVEDGVLSLDDTVETWLPGLVAGNGNDGASITVRHLLQHRSGINNHVDDLLAELGASTSAEQIDELLHRAWDARALVALATSHPPVDEAGEIFHYTDTGYLLIGLIIEAATGATWEDALEERILRPLQLRDTSVPRGAQTIDGRHMRGYSMLPFSEGLVDVTEIDTSSLSSAAAIISTPRDVNRFFEALLQGTFFGPALMEEMKATLPTGGEDEPRYGLGLAWIELSCGGGFYMHTGDTLGYHTRNGVSESGDASVCIAVSGDSKLERGFEAEAGVLIERALCTR